MFTVKLFDPDIEPCCSYCEHGALTQDGQSILCQKKGVMLPSDSCRKFRYDPLERVPGRRIELPKHDAEEFSL